MKVKKISKKKVILSFIIGSLLMFSIILSILSVFTKVILLNYETYINMLEKKETYRQIYEFLEGNLEYALTINNIPSSVKDGVISLEEVEYEVNSIIRNTVNYFVTGINEINPIDTNKYLERLNENLDNYIRDNSIHIDSNIQNELDILKSDISQIIQSELEIINSDIIINSSICTILSKITTLFIRTLYLVPIILSVVFTLILSFIWRNDITRLFQWLGNSIIAAGLFIFIIFFSGYISGFYNNVIIDIIYLKEFVASLIKSWTIILTLSGAIISIVGFLMLIPIIKNYIKRSKMIKKYL